ncbi:MAG: 16S rRNA (uracil(1498)-N(3))-methyltransferase [Prevotellaceae bacterium]|jgi:16S rRNA (uracil1498-N3)-methyltransferase|nr:16S rRNA (uracil(1498)-N(3))-methyltransferase [Prevotellaceae bacterium]
MTIFYAPDIEKSPFLPEEESQHAVKVLRMKSGDKICVIDGAGGLYEAEIALPHPKHCEVKILQKTAEYGKRNHYLHIGIAPTKNIERLEWFVEKAVEIGIDEITPIVCQHSERKVLKTERLQKIILAAAKQSLKAYLPRLNDIVTFEKLINTPFLGNKYIAHCYEEERELLQNIYTKGQSALILIGAEGDFSREEVQAALKNGFLPVSLGNSRLRTETAGVVACHTVNLINE